MARFVIGKLFFCTYVVYMYTRHGMSMVYGGAVDYLEGLGSVCVCFLEIELRLPGLVAINFYPLCLSCQPIIGLYMKVE